MKHFGSLLRAATRTALAGTLTWLTAHLVAAENPATSKSAELANPKNHTLFMGTDISIEHEGKLYRVQDVFSTTFIISVDGKKTGVPMHGTPRKMRLEQSLKLTNVSASLTGLKAERAYTPLNDPRMKRQIEASQISAVVGDNSSLAMGKFEVAQNKFGVAINPDAATGAAISAANLDAAAAAASKEATTAENMSSAQFNSDSTNPALGDLRAKADLSKELFDAVEVEFEISAQAELHKPYVVLIARYHEREKPKYSRDLIYARALDSIGPTPQHVHILQGGLPEGFELENYQVHLYDLGQEVATDVAPKRVPLTREEAFEYLKAEYIGSHKGATLPASPAMGKLGIQTKAQLAPSQLNGAYFVRVTSEGKPLRAFMDEACSQPVDDAIDSLVKTVRFFPALDHGKCIEGVARLTFSHLTR